ncbi:MAG: DUF362 domain-containing protein [Planctomycetes bacterium]|nr:DUF362 domain-containing protein [Planctomycetota bacterium]
MNAATGITRRAFLTGAAAAAGAGAAGGLAAGCAAEAPTVAPAGGGLRPAPVGGTRPAATPGAKSRVVVIRHDALAADGQGPPPGRVRELLDEAACALAGDARAADAWARWFKPADRVGIKVNCLGYPTRPAVAAAIAAAIAGIGLAPEQVIIWDRTVDELRRAGYEPRASGRGVRCFGTDALAPRGGGYGTEIITSGAIGSLYSRIVTDETTALVSACVLKDHNLAGLTCAMKNFFGAIHNPNKYHDDGCDPFIADVCAGPPVRDRLRLAVCDALRPQYQGGPSHRTQWQWPYGGLLVSADPVALDRVALEVLARKRAAAGLKPLEAEGRPARHLASAEARGLGAADLARIEVIGIGKTWMDVA